MTFQLSQLSPRDLAVNRPVPAHPLPPRSGRLSHWLGVLMLTGGLVFPVPPKAEAKWQPSMRASRNSGGKSKANRAPVNRSAKQRRARRLSGTRQNRPSRNRGRSTAGSKKTRSGTIARRSRHGNSASSNRPTHVYVIMKTYKPGGKRVGKTTIEKFGISGSTPRVRHDKANAKMKYLSPRAHAQARALNRKAKAENSGFVYSTRIVRFMNPQPPGRQTARARALSLERDFVTRHFDRRNRRVPPLNLRPSPFPQSGRSRSR
jgi:hypothetical protein